MLFGSWAKAMVFGIGLAMFMCPIVLGSAVYLFVAHPELAQFGRPP